MDFLALAVEPSAGEFHQHPAAGAALIHSANPQSRHGPNPPVHIALASPAGDDAAEDDIGVREEFGGARLNDLKQSGNEKSQQDAEGSSRH